MTSNVRALRPDTTPAQQPETPVTPPPAWWNKDAPPLTFWKGFRKFGLTEDTPDPSVMVTVEKDFAYNNRPWRVSWQRTFTSDERTAVTSGRFWLSKIELEVMFGLDDKELNSIADLGVPITERREGAFIREGAHLNIPGPAPANCFENSISVLVTPELKEKVREFLA